MPLYIKFNWVYIRRFTLQFTQPIVICPLSPKNVNTLFKSLMPIQKMRTILLNCNQLSTIRKTPNNIARAVCLSVCLSVHLPSRNISAPNGLNFMTILLLGFIANLSKYHFWWMTETTETLHEDTNASLRLYLGLLLHCREHTDVTMEGKPWSPVSLILQMKYLNAPDMLRYTYISYSFWTWIHLVFMIF
jgi:hypothetical protein